MQINGYVLLMIFGSFMTAVSQIMLKSSANQLKGKKFFEKFLNLKVFVAYVIFFGVIALNLYAFRGVGFKYSGIIIISSNNIFVFLLSLIFLKEKITKNKLVGNLIILLGIAIYGVS